MKLSATDLPKLQLSLAAAVLMIALGAASVHLVLNSTRTDDRIEDYDLLQEKLFAKAPANGMRSLVESWQGHIFPSRAYEDGGIHEAIADYEDAVFYDILAEELARRDLGLENSDPEDATELTNRMDEYMAEFEKNGLNTINIDI